jgi:myosin heavy subunit
LIICLFVNLLITFQTEQAYKSLQESGKSQAVIISGESGAGKTEATKKILQLLAEASNRAVRIRSTLDGQSVEGDTSLETRILQCNPILEAFGNAKTLRNDNSSRFGKWTSIQFEHGRCGRAEGGWCRVTPPPPPPPPTRPGEAGWGGGRGVV